jgi:hypothetical protein
METKQELIDEQPRVIDHEITIQKPQGLATQNISPVMELAGKLANGKITAEQMEKMLDVHIKWEKNEAEKAYHSAMAKFHEDVPSIIKTKEGHNSKYAGLSDIVAAVAPKLSAQGLSHTWVTKTVETGIMVDCKITHEMGHSESTSMTAGPDGSGNKNAIQAIGSTVTYLQRYTLKAALGIAEGDQDDDGAASQPPPKPLVIPEPNENETEVIRLVCLGMPHRDGMVPSPDKIGRLFYVSGGNNEYPSNPSTVGDICEWFVKGFQDSQMYDEVK